jgi:hypothetical protein
MSVVKVLRVDGTSISTAWTARRLSISGLILPRLIACPRRRWLEQAGKTNKAAAEREVRARAAINL